MELRWIWDSVEDDCIWILVMWLLGYVGLNVWLSRGRSVHSRQLMTYGRRTCLLKWFLMISAIVYVFLFLYATLLGREHMSDMHYELSFLWEYWRAFKLDGGRIQIESMDWVWQILNNILLFVPMGVLCGGFVRAGWWRTGLIGLLISAAVEISQLVFRLGLFEFDDMFHNTLGMLAGYGYFVFCDKICKKQIDRKAATKE